MNLYQNELYIEDINYITSLDLPWDALKNKTFLISGASGMIGSCLIDALIHKNINIKILALARNEKKAKARFADLFYSDNFTFIQHDVNDPLDDYGYVDFIIHAASNTHPRLYATDPIGTIITNIIGTYNLLNYAVNHGTERFMFLSSVEIYGENRENIGKFKESDLGYIDCNTLRGGYPESKRAGEALCKAFMEHNGIKDIIPRLPRIYGPTMHDSDSKAIAQFIKRGIARQNIVLKSEGAQLFSYCYIADAVTALLTILLKGTIGEAYNIADPASDITLKDLADIIAQYSKKEVVFAIPDAIEVAGYSKATKALLDSRKLKNLGWVPKFDIKSGIRRTINIMSELLT